MTPPKLSEISVLEKKFGGEWRRIPGFERYAIDTTGRVITLERSTRFGYVAIKERALRIKKPLITLDGYARIDLYQGEQKKTSVAVSRLVLLTFVGPGSDGRIQCDHINRNTLDNRLENLRWVTPMENIKNRRTACGSRQGNSILKEHQIPIIREALKKGMKGRDIAILIGCSDHLISKIRKGRAWTHV